MSDDDVLRRAAEHAAAMRVSVSGWRTTAADADRSAAAIAAAWRTVAAG